MSIASEITRLQNAKASLKASIEAKGVTVSSEATLDEYPEFVDAIPTGSSDEVEKTVNFYDYDGTRVYSFTGEEVQALTELPSAPDHSSDEVPLTFDEWNWTLADIKSYNTKYPDAAIWVGANYHTTDGKTHLFYEITTNHDVTGVSLYLPAIGGTVDWGDETSESISTQSISHIYSAPGIYDCTIESNSLYISIDDSSKKLIGVRFSNTITEFYPSRTMFQQCSCLKTISIPNSLTSWDGNNFSYCRSLNCVVIPRGVTTFGWNCFDYAYIDTLSLPNTLTQISIQSSNIKNITFPDSLTGSATLFISYNYELEKVNLPSGLTSLYNYSFQSCLKLKEIVLPPNITTIGASSFYGCSSLQSITIPSHVTEIGSYAFNSCTSMSSIIMEPTIPPTIQSNTFSYNTSSTQYLKKIYVPAESVEDYKAATNWIALSDIIEAMPS